MTQELRQRMSSLAEEAPQTDVYDQVMAKSRSMTVRRGVLSGTLALAVIAGLSGTGYALLPEAGEGLPGENGGSAASGDPHRPGDEVGGAADIPGDLIYRYGFDEQALVFHHTAGESVDSLAETGQSAVDTMAMSADGRYVSAADTDLSVVDLATSAHVELEGEKAAGMVDFECTPPTWSPVANEILYVVAKHDEIPQVRISDAETGELVTAFDVDGCDYRWSADGQKLIYANDSDVSVVDRDGENPQDYRLNFGGDFGTVNGLTADGKTACVAVSDGIERVLGCDKLYDLESGEVIVPHEVPGDVIDIKFTASGEWLYRSRMDDGAIHLYLVDGSGGVVAEDDEPAEYRDSELLGYQLG